MKHNTCNPTTCDRSTLVQHQSIDELARSSACQRISEATIESAGRLMTIMPLEQLDKSMSLETKCLHEGRTAEKQMEQRQKGTSGRSITCSHTRRSPHQESSFFLLQSLVVSSQSRLLQLLSDRACHCVFNRRAPKVWLPKRSAPFRQLLKTERKRHAHTADVLWSDIRPANMACPSDNATAGSDDDSHYDDAVTVVDSCQHMHKKQCLQGGSRACIRGRS